ncbi:MAG TPA: LuxR C-terminal-related transcriptional regulator [Pseudonocardiaceae bacterium]|nr:LuxR C-terminal-related transcriptional regulator [Pseudonocardiaceae bacterium]
MRRGRLASLSAAVRTLGRHADQIGQAGPRLSLLTSREREVVEHLVGGVTDREIARSLAISPRTVHKNLESAYRKLRIGNRTSLISLIHQNGHAALAGHR